MTLKFKTNRNGLIVWFLPVFFICVTIFLIPLVGEYGFHNERFKVDKSLYILFGSMLTVYLIGILFVKFWNRKQYYFSEIYIQSFKFKRETLQVKVEEISTIRYVRFNYKYIWKRICGDPMNEGFACKMYVFLKSGGQITLGCFTTRQAKKIKSLYRDLVQII